MVLGVLAVATLLLPVSYRAGTDDVHPHTIVQGMVDAFLGAPHHHHETEGAHGAHPSPAPRGPDVPATLGLSMPISATSEILVLALLVAALLAGDVKQAIWSARRVLAGRLPAVESPPPQVAA